MNNVCKSTLVTADPERVKNFVFLHFSDKFLGKVRLIVHSVDTFCYNMQDDKS